MCSSSAMPRGSMRPTPSCSPASAISAIAPATSSPATSGNRSIDWLASGKPFLGICVGYQLLFESSEESPGEPGFGFFPGQVKKFRAPGLKVPQIGWNSLELTQPAHPLWRSLPSEPYVFFVHSYFPASQRDDVVIARTTYGDTFASGAALGNVAGVQFHPEKSQATGLAVLGNFVRGLHV